MKESTLKRLEAEFAVFPVMSSGPPDNDRWREEIAKLDFPPPDDYIEFIERFGGSIVGPFPIIGVGLSVAMGTDEGSVRAFTDAFRADGWPATDSWVVFSRDLAGNPIGFDATGVVWSWDHDARRMDRLADSFEDFILRHCLPNQ